MSEERIEEMNPLFYDAVFFNTVFFISASRYRMDGRMESKIKYNTYIK